MTRDGKIIGYGLLSCVAALTVAACWFLYQERQDSRAVASGGTAALAATVKQIQSTAAAIGGSDQQIVSTINSITSEITRPCRGKGDTADNCGLLAETKKVEAKLGDAVVTTQLQVAGSQTLMNAAAKAIAGAGDDIHTATGHLDTAIDTANATMAGFQPVLEKLPAIETSTQLAIAHIDALSQSPDVKLMLSNGGKITTSFASMADTGAKVATKEGNSILHPSPWKAAYPWMMLGGKTAACIWAGAC